MIFNWFPPKKYSAVKKQDLWEYSEKPVLNNFDVEHEKITTLIAELSKKLDELKVLIDQEMKQK